MDKLLRASLLFCKRNASTILTCVGGAGVITTTVLAVKATPKAVKLIEEAEKEKEEKLTTLEKVAVAGPAYIPAVVIGVSTLACIFGANILNKRQQAALISAYAFVDNSYREYKEKLKELYGEEAHNNIIDAIAVEKAINANVRAYGPIGTYSLTEDSSCSDPVLFYDAFSERIFESTIEKVMEAEYHFNRNFVLRGFCPLNELYSFLGLEETEYGSTVGWSVEDELYWIDFGHRKITLEDGTECFVIETPYGPSAESLEYYYY